VEAETAACFVHEMPIASFVGDCQGEDLSERRGHVCCENVLRIIFQGQQDLFQSGRERDAFEQGVHFFACGSVNQGEKTEKEEFGRVLVFKEVGC